MATICVQAFVSGKVQGVWFRQSTRQQALKHGVKGWAKNLPDGRVEVLLCGAEEAVSRVKAWLYQGPELARVKQVQASQVEYQVIEDFVTG